MSVRPAAALFVAIAVAIVGSAGNAGAFSVNVHEGITAAGLFPPSGQTLTFLRPAVFDDIADQHAQIDGGLSGARDERHFDDCEFDGAAEFIRDRYDDVRDALGTRDPWDATDEFGDALHPVQDFYAHSNWVEMGFPLTRRPGDARGRGQPVRPRRPQRRAARRLAAPGSRPPAAGSVRGDILLGADDWSISARLVDRRPTAADGTSRR